MINKIVGTIVIVGCIVFCTPEIAEASDAAPCPPKLFGGDSGSGDSPECGSQPDSDDPDPIGTADTEYGPTQIKSGQCPRIPTSFAKTHLVRTESEFASAYSAVKPGEAIVIRDGTYTWNTDRTLDKRGSAETPIYILSETLQKAVFTNNNAEFKITGSHHVIAGLRFNASNDEVFRVNGPDNRVACHYFQTSGGRGYVYVDGGGAADRTEIDNNVFDNQTGIAVNVNRCDPQKTSCTNNPVGAHIHHNTWKNRSPDGNGSEALKLGSGYQEPAGATIYSVDRNNLDAIVENNYFENWNGEDELISIKGDRNIIRNNCIKGSTISAIVIRNGNNNLITGNWSDPVREGIRVSGRRNYYVFNYRRAYKGGQMFRLHPGELHEDGSRHLYTDATRNVLRYNVTSHMTKIVETKQRQPGSYIFVANPTGNVISDNLIYSGSLIGTNASGSYVNSDGRWTEAQFRANNTWGKNTIVGDDLPASDCGNPALFDGPGGANASIPGSSHLLGAPTTINAPSWW